MAERAEKSAGERAAERSEKSAGEHAGKSMGECAEKSAGKSRWPSWLPRPIRLSSGWGLVRRVRDFDGEPVRALQIGGVYQSATYLDERRMEPVFSYYRAFDHAFTLRPDTRRVLIIGGGGYAWPKHVLATCDDVSLDVVEIDASVTEAARRWFFLDEAMALHPGRCRLITGDGRAVLEAGAVSAGGPYDAIVLDAFEGAEPVRALATVEAARVVRANLASDGLALANVVSAEAGADIEFLRDIVASFAEVFAHVHVIPCEDDPFAVEDNYLLVATDAEWPAPDAIPFDEEFLGEAMYD